MPIAIETLQNRCRDTYQRAEQALSEFEPCAFVLRRDRVSIGSLSGNSIDPISKNLRQEAFGPFIDATTVLAKSVKMDFWHLQSFYAVAGPFLNGGFHDFRMELQCISIVTVYERLIGKIITLR